jgi:hypothetical protein
MAGRSGVECVLPVNLTRVVVLELCLHDNRPDIHTQIKGHDSDETDLCTTTLADVLHVEYKAETKASDDTKEW